MRLPQMGTFDNYNGIVEIGRIAAGYGAMGSLVYDRLLEDSIDEPASAYARLADGVAVEKDYRWTAFRLRAEARWHDGRPITPDDVLFTFDAIREHGSVALRTALADLERIVPFGERELCFVSRPDAEPNPITPFIYGRIAILPKHYWSGRDITRTTVEPALGSGPYRLRRAVFGRSLVYERVPHYWGRDLPVNAGRFNFDTVKFDYFRDENVMLEAHKGDVVDVREESISKNWATQYDFPAVRQGLFKAQLRDVARIWGLWWPLFWNLREERFQDIRVREALWLLRDFDYINRVYFYGFYDHGVSFFQNSPMAHGGLPSAAELALLAPWRHALPKRVFEMPFRQPANDGYGFSRTHVKRALELFDAAGWHVVDGTMRNKRTGEPFTIDLIFVSPFGVRSNTPYMAQLNRVGIDHGARPGSFPLAVPQPHRPLRRQRPELRPHPHAGSAAAQPFRQRQRRRGLRAELGRHQESRRGCLDRRREPRPHRRAALCRHPRARPRAVVELLLHPRPKRPRHAARVLGSLRRSAARRPGPRALSGCLVVGRSEGGPRCFRASRARRRVRRAARLLRATRQVVDGFRQGVVGAGRTGASGRHARRHAGDDIGQHRVAALGAAPPPGPAVAELRGAGDAGVVAGVAVAHVEGLARMLRFVRSSAARGEQGRKGQCAKEREAASSALAPAVRQPASVLRPHHSRDRIAAARSSVASSLAKQKRR